MYWIALHELQGIEFEFLWLFILCVVLSSADSGVKII